MALPKLAIISTFDDLCGIASYTRAIVEQLSPFFEIKVFDLDQFLLSNIQKNIVSLADKEIDQMCNEIKNNFQLVNLQLEHGTLGKKPNIIFKRLKKIIQASPKLCITFHTVIQSENQINWQAMRGYAKKLEVKKMRSHINHIKNTSFLSGEFYKLILEQQRRNKPISIITHTKKDYRYLSVIEGLKNVYHHPLVYMGLSEAKEITEKAQLDTFPALSDLPENKILLGCFGFYGLYKGTETAIQALKMLPNNYHLAIFGGVHPNSISKNELINDNVERILSNIAFGKTKLDAVIERSNKAQNISFELNHDLIDDAFNETYKDDLSSRVHFAGTPSEKDFPAAMAICDIVLLPYNEVGQSASGPGSMAIDMRKNIIASRTKTFLQLDRYYPGFLNFFDIGNSLQLSQIIKGLDLSKDIFSKEYPYGVESNIALYKNALFCS